MLTPGVVVAAGMLEIEHSPLPADQVESGTPTTGAAALDTIGDCEVGVWEMTAGVATDTEAEEVFVVLAGRGTVSFTEPARPTIELGPGAVVRLTDGMRTVWTVTETLRGVYLASLT